MQAQTELAHSNFIGLIQNPYPGRGIVAGLDKTGEYLIQVYWIMGRSDNSRNRIFKEENDLGKVSTVPADSTKMKDPSLVIYNAMRERGRHFIVSNGDQTDTVMEAQAPLYLNVALAGREHEPDAPNFTQRITAVSSLSKGRPLVQMSILRKSPLGVSRCDRVLYEYQPSAGFGHCITTYAGDGDPLPPFCGEPLLMPLMGGLTETAESYWAVLNSDNRVSLAVKFIETANGRSCIHVINKYMQVG